MLWMLQVDAVDKLQCQSTFAHASQAEYGNSTTVGFENLLFEVLKLICAAKKFWPLIKRYMPYGAGQFI